jgi:hypothetical protein
MKICSVEGCERGIVARNLCTKHYQYFKYHGKLPDFGRTGRTVVPVTHPIYKVWGGMKNRCDNPNNRSYPRYGGAGVTYDPAWADFNNFYRDMIEGYRKGLLLDRENGKLPYCKTNCRWVDYTQSNRNRSFVKVSEELAAEIRDRYADEPVTQQQLADDYGLDQTTISDIVTGRSWKL